MLPKNYKHFTEYRDGIGTNCCGLGALVSHDGEARDCAVASGEAECAGKKAAINSIIPSLPNLT